MTTDQQTERTTQMTKEEPRSYAEMLYDWHPLEPRDAFFFGLGMGTAGVVTWDTFNGPWLVGYGVVVVVLYAIFYFQTEIRGRGIDE